MNDIYKVSHQFKVTLFADDTNLLYSHQNLKSLELIVNNELIKLYDWLTVNKLTLNTKKSNYIIFRPHQKRLNCNVSIKFFDNNRNAFVPLEYKSHVKYLGIYFDQHLSWKFHINLICSKISRTVGIIAKLRHYVPCMILLSLYNSLILPYISYGLSAWGQAAKCHLDKVLKLQKRALRFIHFADFRSSAIPLFYLSNISPLNVLFVESVAGLMYDVHVEKAPDNISDLFSYVADHHSYDTRAAKNMNMYCQHSRLNINYKSFSRFGVRLWNAIPQHTKNLSKKTFKKKVKNHLLQYLNSNRTYQESEKLVEAFS